MLDQRSIIFVIIKTLSSDKRYKIAALLDSRRKTLFQLIENQHLNLCKFFKNEKIISCSKSKLLNIENSFNPRYF